MDAILQKFTDPYERKARLYPALLALLPIVMIIAVYTNWLTFDVENALFIAIAAAGLFWLAGKTRELGKAVETRLVPTWKGMPSVTLLRHRDNVLDRYTTQRYHSAGLQISGISMPSPAEEERDPEDADERYQAVTTALLSKTRNTTEYPLLFKENINYGFWRNMRGIKSFAIVLALATIATGSWFDRQLIISYEQPDGPELALVLAGILTLIVWITTVSDEAVRRAAENYAKRLLEALDTP